MYLQGSFLTVDSSGAPGGYSALTVNVYVGNASAPDSVLSSQASGVITRDPGRYSYLFDVSSYPVGTYFVVDVIATVSGHQTTQTFLHQKPGLTSDDLKALNCGSSCACY